MPIGAHFLVSSTLSVLAQSDIQKCQSLADLRIEDTKLLSATVVPASGDLPEYCRVLGYVRPAINFEIRLPTTSWNGKFFMAGCGAFCGKLESNSTLIPMVKTAFGDNYKRVKKLKKKFDHKNLFRGSQNIKP
ncbi:tannase/feruloyl esterase family alpha/beta hydrolase [Aliifodinibius sp. S!AR15-10]|uniref:BBE domain-containing protein n=1 Tax=Aliifodinibius sp. S!AR15-10 TaxID=2950437 RepID=UPI00285C645A|nr:BBE domain-containing protein [Aliifodinibius sp. S!AR15-10]MDR8393532.1 tannase/feruloyl esterase family alpha/beta hydrolase [Aliifodinibius sp. S!AR15-10]